MFEKPNRSSFTFTCGCALPFPGQVNLQDLAKSLEAIPLQHSPGRDRVLVVCGMWKKNHSVYRNFQPFVRVLQAAFQVCGKCKCK